MHTTFLRAGTALASLVTSAAAADFAPASLRLQLAAEPPPAPAVADPTPTQAPMVDAPARVTYTSRGSQWWSVGASAASDSGAFDEVQVYGQFSRFVVDRMEVIGELSLRHFDMDSGSALGINPAIIFRYHWWTSDEEATWTFYTDIGIGFVLSTDDVPDTGSSFNFTPRLGLGITRRLDENIRLLLGLRWSHVSNARLWGDDDNPGSDAPMVHVGVIWEF
jgi:hypothetical protein